MTTAAAPPDLANDSAPRSGLRDFPDRLSPMLVKELRQGLKSPVFLLGLMALQTAFVFITITAVVEGNVLASSRAFWWSTAGVLCILLPLRVTNAMRDEMGGHTMDMLVLTRLSAWRIVFGKWLAAAALQMLVAVTVLPYLIMRYFAGGVDLPQEVSWLAVLMALGLLVTAIALGLSWFRFFLVRAVVLLAVFYMTSAACAGIIHLIERPGMFIGFQRFGWPGLALLLLLAVWLGFFFLDLGVARIAPLSENRSTRRRLAGVILLAAGGVCCFKATDTAVSLRMGIVLVFAAVMVCVQALCETPVNLVPVLKPFVKRGWPGRLAGRLLYPGWHTGLFFSLLLFVAAVALVSYLYVQMSTVAVGGWTTYRPLVGAWMTSRGFASTPWGNFDLWPWIMVLCGVTGTFIVPLVVWRIIARMKRWSFWHWLGVAVCSLLTAWLSLTLTKSFGIRASVAILLPSGGLAGPAAAEQETKEQVKVLFPEPLARLWADQERWEKLKKFEIQGILCLAAGFSLLSWLTLAVAFAMEEMRKTREAERELASALQEPAGQASQAMSPA